MKIEKLIVQHLYNSKKVTLQGIGTFKLNPAVFIPADIEKDKDFEMPDNAFEFEYNLKAQEDEALVQYIVQHTNKILPLASSDLDSYVILAKQFLNIGKPLVIEGVGTIQKNQAGNYQFTPGHFISPRIDDIPKQARERIDETVSFESEGPTNNSRRNLMIFVTILIIVLTGLGIYYLVTNRNTSFGLPESASTATNEIAPADTTLRSQPDSTVQPTAVPLTTDSSTFKIVLKNYPSTASVQRALNKLKSFGHQPVIIVDDSTNYQLAFPFTTPLSDTSRALDSLKRFFGGNPFVRF